MRRRERENNNSFSVALDSSGKSCLPALLGHGGFLGLKYNTNLLGKQKQFTKKKKKAQASITFLWVELRRGRDLV